MPTVGQRIKRARTKLNLTQQMLAERVNVTRVAVSEWERDLSLPRVNKAKMLACVLGLSETELTPLRGAGVVPLTDNGTTHRRVTLEWLEVPMIARSNAAVADNDSVPTDTLYQMTIEDNSMSPVFNPGDIISVSPAEIAWDGCQVVVVSSDETTGMLRNYRNRQFGGFDLWPNSPDYPTETIADSSTARIVGVVTSHERFIKRPDGA